MNGKASCRRATCDMTPTRLPVLPAIPFRCSNRSRRQHTETLSVLTAGMPENLTRVLLQRHTGVKNLRCFLSRRRYVFICWSSIGGIWELGLTQTIPEINIPCKAYIHSPHEFLKRGIVHDLNGFVSRWNAGFRQWKETRENQNGKRRGEKRKWYDHIPGNDYNSKPRRNWWTCWR